MIITIVIGVHMLVIMSMLQLTVHSWQTVSVPSAQMDEISSMYPCVNMMSWHYSHAGRNLTEDLPGLLSYHVIAGLYDADNDKLYPTLLLTTQWIRR